MGEQLPIHDIAKTEVDAIATRSGIAPEEPMTNVMEHTEEPDGQNVVTVIHLTDAAKKRETFALVKKASHIGTLAQVGYSVDHEGQEGSGAQVETPLGRYTTITGTGRSDSRTYVERSGKHIEFKGDKANRAAELVTRLAAKRIAETQAKVPERTPEPQNPAAKPRRRLFARASK